MCIRGIEEYDYNFVRDNKITKMRMKEPTMLTDFADCQPVNFQCWVH